MDRSIWSDGFSLPTFSRQTENFKTDVLIIGGGIAGILCARRLQQDGVDYALIEADRICRGVTRNTTAKITSQHGLIYHKLLRKYGAEIARGYWQANEAALEKFRILAREIDCDFESKDNYIYASYSREKPEREMEAMDKLGIPASYFDDLSIAVPVTGAIMFPNQAQFHPLKFISGIVPGLRIYEQTKAMEFVGNKVRTNRGTITADKIIIATHFPILNKHGGYFLKQYQSRSYVLAMKNAADVGGMYLGIDGEKFSLRNQGEYLILGGGDHRTGKKGRGWEPLENFARIHYPEAQITNRWATQDCMTLDDIPYIGHYSSRTPNLYAATGFNKWGMTSSMVAADILADLVQNRENRYAHIFRPNRSILHPQLACNSLESAVNLLIPTKPRCPHLGCALKWNRQERSWDCPCHGSRFSEDGKLLNNPATDDLRSD